MKRRKKKVVSATRQKDWSERMLKEGNCATCGRPREFGAKRFCPEHLAKDAETHRRMLGLKPWEKTGRGRPPLSITT